MLWHRCRRPSLRGIRKTPVRGRTPLVQAFPRRDLEGPRKGQTTAALRRGGSPAREVMPWGTRPARSARNSLPEQSPASPCGDLPGLLRSEGRRNKVDTKPCQNHSVIIQFAFDIGPLDPSLPVIEIPGSGT